jgi:hypothetical protein
MNADDRVGACVAGYIKSSRLTRTCVKGTKKERDPTDSSLSETMAARIEVKELGDPAHQKKITDVVEALDGVIEAKIENGALHVSYDPLATSVKRKSNTLSVLPGVPSKPQPQIQKQRIRTCHRRMYSKLPSKIRTEASAPDPS